MTLHLRATATVCSTTSHFNRRINMSELTITKDNFEKEVLNSDIPVLLDFWAAWCGPCRMLAPAVSELAQEYSGRVKVGKVNVDEQAELAMKFNITSIPTIIVFKDGTPTASSVGYCSKEQLAEMLK